LHTLVQIHSLSSMGSYYDRLLHIAFGPCSIYDAFSHKTGWRAGMDKKLITLIDVHRLKGKITVIEDRKFTSIHTESTNILRSVLGSISITPF
jgi:hypothetical protein